MRVINCGAASGGLSSGVGSVMGTSLGKAGQYVQGALTGGFGSSIAGGSFWSGAGQGLITAGLNHAAHGAFQGDPPDRVQELLNKLEFTDELSKVFYSFVDAGLTTFEVGGYAFDLVNSPISPGPESGPLVSGIVKVIRVKIPGKGTLTTTVHGKYSKFGKRKWKDYKAARGETWDPKVPAPKKAWWAKLLELVENLGN